MSQHCIQSYTTSTAPAQSLKPPSCCVHHHTPPYTSLHPVLFLYEGDNSLRKNSLKMEKSYYEASDLPMHVCNFKQNETKKYREAICSLFECKYEAVAMDGNCFFAAVSTCLAHFKDPVRISAADLRARVVAWLVECKVRVPINPYTTLHHLVIGRKAWRGWEGMPQIHGSRVECPFV